jgi:hypothetical protein
MDVSQTREVSRVHFPSFTRIKTPEELEMGRPPIYSWTFMVPKVHLAQAQHLLLTHYATGELMDFIYLSQKFARYVTLGRTSHTLTLP